MHQMVQGYTPSNSASYVPGRRKGGRTGSMGRDLVPGEWMGGRVIGVAGERVSGQAGGWARRREGRRGGNGDPGVVLLCFTRLGSTVKTIAQ